MGNGNAVADGGTPQGFPGEQGLIEKVLVHVRRQGEAFDNAFQCRLQVVAWDIEVDPASGKRPGKQGEFLFNLGNSKHLRRNLDAIVCGPLQQVYLIDLVPSIHQVCREPMTAAESLSLLWAGYWFRGDSSSAGR